MSITLIMCPGGCGAPIAWCRCKKKVDKIKLSSICYINGEYNEYYDIVATENGIEIPEFGIEITWHEIEEAKSKFLYKKNLPK